MSAESVGQIGLDLVVNQKQFNKQMTGIQSLAKKAGVALAGAFAVDKLVKFGKECINLGSDLAEVQNVVDVTFPKMSAQVDEFAKNAASAFGLSETMAKQYTGTLGSMAKAFGFSEEQAFNMGSTLAGLAGDVASFYNLSQDEAYTKLKSVFTGETESLKDLGVVMTQTALDSYAMSHGFGKVTSAMSEAEKVALRYAFVQDRLKSASGDFMRTSDSWSNQVKVLNLQFESLKATIGQGLIAAFTPVIKVINALLQKVQVLAVAFKDLMEGLFGKNEESNALVGAAQSASDATASMESNTGATVENLKKASKFLAGFDAINKVPESAGTSKESGAENLNIGGGAVLDLTQKAEGSTSGAIGKLEGFIAYIKEKFSPSFERAWGKLSEPVKGFKTNFSRVFSDLESLAQPLTDYLSGPFLEHLSTSFETAGTIGSGLLDSFNMVFGDIWDVAMFPLLEKFTTEWLPKFTEAGTKLNEFTGKVFESLKKAFDTVWEDAAKPVLEFLTDAFIDFMGILEEFWNDWGEPIFNDLNEAIESTEAAFSKAWEEIKPVFDDLGAAAEEIWEDYLSPLLENFMDLVGEFVDGAIKIYNEFIGPTVERFMNDFKPALEFVIKLASALIKNLLGVIDGLVTAFKGLVQFVVGVFTGDWEKAWTGIENIFIGVFNSLTAGMKETMNFVIGLINDIIGKINSISIDMPDWLGGGTIGFDIPELPMLDIPKMAESGSGELGSRAAKGTVGKLGKVNLSHSIPKLADGGFVRRNTPQLAIIGDNRHQGEVVAPEGKLLEMAKMAAGAGGNPELLRKIIELLETLISLVQDGDDIVLAVDGEELVRAVQTGSIRLKRRFTTIEVTT